MSIHIWEEWRVESLTDELFADTSTGSPGKATDEFDLRHDFTDRQLRSLLSLHGTDVLRRVTVAGIPLAPHLLGGDGALVKVQAHLTTLMHAVRFLSGYPWKLALAKARRWH